MGIALGYALDRCFADPQRFHPVAGFGQAAAALEAYSYRDSKLAGTAHTAALLVAVAATGWVAERATHRSATATVAVTAVATWATLGGTSLIRVGAEMSERLYDDDIDEARALLPSCAAATRTCSMSAASPGPPRNLWRRTPPTRTPGPWSGQRLPESPGSWPIAPPTPSMR